MTPASADDFDALVNSELCDYQKLLDLDEDGSRRSSWKTQLPESCRQEFEALRQCLDELDLYRAKRRRKARTVVLPKAESSFHPLPQIPSQIGRFPILELLGHGGCGIVYRGLDPRIGRQVAIKIPRPEVLASAEMIERFAQEAQTVSQLEHPNILPVYESQATGAAPYIVMPYIAGGSLSRWLAIRPAMPPRQAAEIVRQLADGLAHSHLRGVLHRDVKPANVLLAPIDPASTSSLERLEFLPRLTDFGLAKVTTGQSQQTQTGTVMGTTCYMSPEQALGKSREITALTDVYSLGAVLYELLTGEPPFRGENDFQTIQMISQTEIRSPVSLNPRIPKNLDLICRKCLEKVPADRYPSARAMADDLERFLNGEPIAAQPVSMGSIFTKYRRRHPVVASLISSGIVALIILVSLSLWFNQRLTEQLKISEDAREMAIRERRAAENERQIAREHELKARRRAYVADMNKAWIAWEKADVDSAISLVERYRPREGEHDLRDFAWWSLWREYSESSQVLGSHEGAATAVAMSRDGLLVASGGTDSRIKLWSIPTSELLCELHGHEKQDVTSLCFSPDSERLLSTGEDGTVRVWDVKTRTQLFVLNDHGSTVSRAIYSPRGELIASGGDDRQVRLWDAESGKSIAVFSGHTDNLRSLAFHPTEPLLISGARDGMVRFWDIDRRSVDQRLSETKPLHLSTGEFPSIRDIVIEANGQSLIAATGSDDVFQMSLQDGDFGQIISRSKSGAGPTFSVTWPNHHFPIFATGNNEIRSVEAFAPKWGSIRLQGHFDIVLSIASSINGENLVSASRDGTVRLWKNYRTRNRILPPDLSRTRWQDSDRRLQAARVQWSERYLAADFHQSELVLYQLPDRKLFKTIPLNNDDHFLLSRHGRRLVITKSDGKLTCYSLESDQVVWTQQFSPSPFYLNTANSCFAIDPTESYLPVIDKERGIQIVSLADGTIKQRINHAKLVYHVQFLIDDQLGLLVAGGYHDGFLRIWRVETGELVKEFQAHRHGLRNLSVSPDWRFVATSGADGKLRVIRLEDLSTVASLPNVEHAGSPGFLAYANILAVWSPAFQIWNLNETAELLTIPADSGNQFFISPDGYQVVISRDESLKILDGRPQP